MSQYHIDRIAKVLEGFSSLVDMSDWSKRSSVEAQAAFLQRSLAALCIKAFAGVADNAAASAVVDGFDEFGMDAIYFDPLNSAFYFVQSKWNQDGSGSLDEASCSKFTSGVNDILSGSTARLNSKIKQKEPEIQSALRSTGPVKIVLITVHTGTQKLGAHQRHLSKGGLLHRKESSERLLRGLLQECAQVQDARRWPK